MYIRLRRLLRRRSTLYLLISALLLLLAAYASQSSDNSFYYSVARVTKVVDGDTVWVRGLCGYRANITFKVRLAAINAPELDTPEGVRAKQELNSLIFGRYVVLAVPRGDERDKYGRTIAVVLLPDGGSFVNVNYLLVRKGLADAVDYGTPPERLLVPDFPVPAWVCDAVAVYK